MSRNQGKILVIRGGAIGDFILTLPVFAALRQQFPQTHLEVLGYPHIAQLALAGGLVDRVQSIEARALAGFFARDGELAEALRKYFSGFAIIISYLYDPDRIFMTNLHRCSKAQIISGPHRPDEKAGMHATEVFLRPLEQLAIFNAPSVPQLRITSPKPDDKASEDTVAKVRNDNDSRDEVPGRIRVRCGERQTLALHPGSGSERKNWPEPKWAELLQFLLKATDLRLLLVGGEAESGRLERLAALVPASRFEIARNLPLSDLALRMSKCVGFIGHDSGITHLAVAVGLPGLVLWRESAETIWCPKGEGVNIIRDTSDLGGITVKRVKQGLASLLALRITETGQ